MLTGWATGLIGLIIFRSVATGGGEALFGGQISRSFAYIEPALKPLIDEVSELKHISTMQHLSTAAPLGLLSMLRKSLNL